MRVAFVGLGVMGFPMAGYLARAGHDVAIFNRTAARADAWQQKYSGTRASTPGEAAADAEIVFCCVGNDHDVRAVILGSRVCCRTRLPAIIVDHTTASAVVAREIHAAAAGKKVGFLDAPLSGGQAGAENGQLTIMVGGDSDVRARIARHAVYAKACTLIGGSGRGSSPKWSTRSVLLVSFRGCRGSLHFAKRAELDVAAVIGAISKGAAQSWQMENRWQTMIDDHFDFGFAVEWMRKDLRIALEEAKRNNATLEMTQLVDNFYAEIEGMGGSRWDTSSLIRRLEKTP
jgi:3-hydroxyisobutyrate dehydrogenase